MIVVSDGWDRGDPALVADRDGPPPAELPSPRLAQPARRHPGLRAARRRDAGGVAVHRRLRPGGHRRQSSSASARSSADRRRGPRGAVGGHARDQRRAVARPERAGSGGGPAAARTRSRSTRTARGRSRDPERLHRRIGGPDAGAARDAGRLDARRAPGSAGPSWSGRSAARRGPRAPCCIRADDGRIAGSVSGGCVEGAAADGDRAGPGGRPQPGHPLRDQRRGGVGRRAGLRRDDRRARRAGASAGRGRGRPRARARRGDDPPGRRAAAARSGATSRATGRAPERADRRLARRLDRRLAGLAGGRRRAPGRGRRRAAARDLADRRRSATARCSSRRSRSGRGS